MKLNKVVFVLITSIFLISSFSMVNMVTASTAQNYENTSTNQCSSPTKTLNIQGESPDHYNVTKFSVAQGTCLAVAFKNADTLAHSFTIDAISADNVAYFTIYLQPGKSATVNFQAPNKDVTIKYYCAVPGHEANGMYGSLVVGKGSSSKSSPGFEMVSVFMGLIGAVGLVALTRKRRN